MVDRRDLEVILDGLLKEGTRRQQLGGYSVDAPFLKWMVDIQTQIALHLLHIERQLAKRQTRKPKK